MRELLLRSIRKPATTGCFSAWLKNSIFCGLPSSRTRKSFFTRLETKRPLSSVTVTGTMTSVADPLNWTRAGSGCGAAGGGVVVGGVVCWGTAGRQRIRPQSELAAKTRRADMTALVLFWRGKRRRGVPRQNATVYPCPACARGKRTRHWAAPQRNSNPSSRAGRRFFFFFLLFCAGRGGGKHSYILLGG